MRQDVEPPVGRFIGVIPTHLLLSHCCEPADFGRCSCLSAFYCVVLCFRAALLAPRLLQLPPFKRLRTDDNATDEHLWAATGSQEDPMGSKAIQRVKQCQTVSEVVPSVPQPTQPSCSLCWGLFLIRACIYPFGAHVGSIPLANTCLEVSAVQLKGFQSIAICRPAIREDFVLFGRWPGFFELKVSTKCGDPCCLGL